MVFPTVSSLSLNLAMRSSWSESQLAPSLVFADCIELSVFDWKEYNQSYFCIDYLMMSMCRIVSCIVGRGCCYDQMPSLGKTLSCLTLWNPMDCTMPGFPVLHHILELVQIHTDKVGDASQLSHPCLLLFLPSVFPTISLFSKKLALCIRWPK